VCSIYFVLLIFSSFVIITSINLLFECVGIDLSALDIGQCLSLSTGICHEKQVILSIVSNHKAVSRPILVNINSNISCVGKMIIFYLSSHD